MSRMRRIIKIMMEALREIFDESGYARYLALHQIPSGRPSYAAFLREQETTKARRPKCC